MADVDVTPDDLKLYNLIAANITVIINVIKLQGRKWNNTGRNERY
jgi:hypothetical protein